MLAERLESKRLACIVAKRPRIPSASDGDVVSGFALMASETLALQSVALQSVALQSVALQPSLDLHINLNAQRTGGVVLHLDRVVTVSG